MNWHDAVQKAIDDKIIVKVYTVDGCVICGIINDNNAGRLTLKNGYHGTSYILTAHIVRIQRKE